MNAKSRLVTLACTAVAAHAGVVALEPIADNTLFENPDGLLSNGAGQHLFSGLTAEPLLRRALLRFDPAGAIPDGATIITCTLTLNMSKTIVGPSPVSLHRVTSAWGEGASDAPGAEGAGADSEPGDATWKHTFFDSFFWGSEGGDFTVAPSAVASVGTEDVYSWGPTPEMVDDLALWLASPEVNHGWVLVGDESGMVSAKRYDSHEHPDPASRPRLVITFIPPCIADWNSDGPVNTIDVLAYLNEWATKSPSADLNFDGAVNTQDLLAFLNHWTVGC